MSLDVKDVKDRFVKVNTYCQKTLQAYRIRLMCLKRRHDLLQKVGGNFDIQNTQGFFNSANTTDDFYTSLRNILNKEKEVLRIMEKCQKDGISVLDLILSELEGMQRDLSDPKNKEVLWLTMRDVSKRSGLAEADSPDAILLFLKDMYHIIKELKIHLKRIESRVEEESKLLSLKVKSKYQFDNFIRQWDAEMRENDELVVLMRDIISRHSKLFNGVRRLSLDKAMEGAGFGAGGGVFVTGMITVMIGMQHPDMVSFKAVAFCALGAGVAGAIGGFLYNLVEQQEAVIGDIRKDRDVLREVEKRRNINTSFFGRMFGGSKSSQPQDQTLLER